MRRLVLILMIALLPLRMWAADGMAVRMAAAEAPPAAAAAEAAMPADCPMMAMGQAGGGQSEEGPGSAAGLCAACHLCAASATHPLAASASAPAPTGPPQEPSARFASAEPAPDHKPPIS